MCVCEVCVCVCVRCVCVCVCVRCVCVSHICTSFDTFMLSVATWLGGCVVCSTEHVDPDIKEHTFKPATPETTCRHVYSLAPSLTTVEVLEKASPVIG